MEVEIRGGQIKVDPEDLHLIKQGHWRIGNKGYVVANSKPDKDGNRRTLLLHRAVMKARKNQCVDHINMDKLDNRKSNLRLCSKSQNNCNAPATKANSCFGYKGVSRWPSKWKTYFIAKLRKNGKEHHLGYFDTPEEAALAYNKAAF